MSSARRRSVQTVVAASLLVAPLVAGCSLSETGFNAPTRLEMHSSIGVNGETQNGRILVRNFHLSPPPDASNATQGLDMFFSISNIGSGRNENAPDTLTQITVDKGGQVQPGATQGAQQALSSASPSPSASTSTSASSTGGSSSGTGLPIDIPVGSGITIAPDAPDALMITGLDQSVQAGQLLKVTMLFKNAGQLVINVPIVAPQYLHTTPSYSPEPRGTVEINPSFTEPPYDLKDTSEPASGAQG